MQPDLELVPIAAMIGFAVAILPIVLTPGASLTLATTSVLAGRSRAVGRIVLGTVLGIATHAVLAALGLSVIIMSSAQIYQAVRVIGAIYLIGLGIYTLCKRVDDPAVGQPTPTGSSIRSAYLANLLNPKAASVYLTLAPQFVGPESFSIMGFLVLAGVHAVLTATWLGGISAILGLVRRRAANLRPLRYVHRAGGAVLILLGLKTLIPARA